MNKRTECFRLIVQIQLFSFPLTPFEIAQQKSYPSFNFARSDRITKMMWRTYVFTATILGLPMVLKNHHANLLFSF